MTISSLVFEGAGFYRLTWLSKDVGCGAGAGDILKNNARVSTVSGKFREASEIGIRGHVTEKPSILGGGEVR